MDEIQSLGGKPVIFQSFGLTEQPAEKLLEAYARIGKHSDGFYAFELGKMFAPFGAIYGLDVYERLIQIPECLGAKHSSLNRQLEWQRLAIRDAVRPDFMVLTGNDLAIDMVMYGSDYLLGLSTFAPAEFARRDRMWESGDSGFYELNDLLQYLGFFAFRSPVPAYKHSVAQFLNARDDPNIVDLSRQRHTSRFRRRHSSGNTHKARSMKRDSWAVVDFARESRQ
ncbi:MAG: hypothetical protein R3C56_07755 [Pirellulaceae bacterium]